MKNSTLNFTKIIKDTLFLFQLFYILPNITIARSGRSVRKIITPKYKIPRTKESIFFIFVCFCLYLFVSITSVQAQEIKGFEYYKVITGRNFAENKSSVGPFKVEADERGGQIKVQVNELGLNRCSEQAAFKWSFDRVLQSFPVGGKFTITGQVGVSGNCTPNSDPFIITKSGGSAAIGLPPNILNTLTQNEQSARGLTLVSNEAGRIYGKGGSYASRIGAGSDTYSFQGRGVLFLKIFFSAGGSGIDQFYDGFAIYFFRPVYNNGGRSGGVISENTNIQSIPNISSGTIVTLQSLNYPDLFIRHRNYLGELTRISSVTDRKDALFRIVPGLANTNFISFESINYPGYYLCHEGFRIKLARMSNNDRFRKDATFKRVKGLANSSMLSFESYNYSGYYIRHRNFHLYLENGNSDLFLKDATFISSSFSR